MTDEKIFECDIEARPLAYHLSAYHMAMSEGPLHYTWTDKPHRLIYDLIAAVKYYAKSEQPAQRTWVGLDPEEIRKTNHHMVDGAYHYSFKQGAEWAEAKLKEKNT